MLHCINCNEDINLIGGLDVWHGDTVVCPHCNAEMQVEYEEYYDDETMEEDRFYWLINKEK